MVHAWEPFFRVSGWKSEDPAVNKFLTYLKFRGIGSESSRRIYCFALYAFCRFTGLLPDGLIVLSKSEVEKLIERFGCSKRESGCSSRTVNVLLSNLRTFFLANGFKGEKELEIEFYRQPARLRVREEYVPTLSEGLRMVDCAKSLRDKTMTSFLLYSGVRESSLLAIKFGDIRGELERGLETLLIRVYPGMKSLVDSACKGNIGYFTFVPKNAVDFLRLYVAQKRERMGEIPDEYPLFSSEHNQLALKDRFSKPLSGRQLQDIVKQAAHDAGIDKWKFVYPHCLRKTCDSFLRSELNDGGRLDMQTQIYLMGHNLPAGLQPYFDAKVEDLRNEYSKLVAVPSDMKLNKAIEALKTVGEVLQVHRVQPSSGELGEAEAVQVDRVTKAIQDLLEELRVSNDDKACKRNECASNVHIPDERKNLNSAVTRGKLAVRERSAEGGPRNPDARTPVKQTDKKIGLATKSKRVKDGHDSRTKQTALNLFF